MGAATVARHQMSLVGGYYERRGAETKNARAIRPSIMGRVTAIPERPATAVA